MQDPNAPIETSKKRPRKPFTTTRVRIRNHKRSSEGVLKRIRDKLLPRLTPEHRTELFDELIKPETPKLLDAPNPGKIYPSLE